MKSQHLNAELASSVVDVVMEKPSWYGSDVAEVLPVLSWMLFKLICC